MRTEHLLRLAAGLVAASAAVAAAEPPAEPTATEAVGVFPIEGESLLVVKNVPGQVLVSTRKAREVRFVSRATDRSGSERPLGVWFDGSTVTLAPLPGAPTPDGILRVEVPETFAVRLEAKGGTSTIDGLRGYVDIRAKDTEVRCRAIAGTLEAAVERGSLRLDTVSGATVRAKDAAVEANEIQGTLVMKLEGTAKLNAAAVRGDIDVDSDGGTVVVKGIDGGMRVRARGGSLEFSEVGAGGDLQLSGSAVKLIAVRGDLTVNSDAPVSFEKTTAALHFDLYGGSLTGNGNQGLVEVRTRNTEINLQAIDGPVRISGDGLKVQVNDVSGELYVEAALSTVVLAKAGGGVSLKIERGDVQLRGASGTISATVTGGDAQLLDLTGPVALEIDGGNAEVSWTSITGETDTFLQNTSGDVTVHFPGNASCRVEAKTKFGRIESDLPTVRVLEDGLEAQGPVGHGRRPTIKVEAEGNVRLLGASGGPAPKE